MALDRHRPVGADAAEDRAGALAQAAQQRAGAPVDEALHQALVQGVGEPVLQRAGAPLPALGIGEPVGAVGDIGERAHAGEARRERVDVAVECGRALANWPCIQSSGSAPVALRQVLEHGRRSGACARPAWSCGSPASGRPPTAGSGWRGRGSGGSRSRRRASWRSVVSSWLSSESLSPAVGGGAASERIRPASDWKSSRALRHSAAVTGAKTWPSTAAIDVRVEVRSVAGDAEGAVAAKAPGAAGDLADLLRMEPARCAARRTCAGRRRRRGRRPCSGPCRWRRWRRGSRPRRTGTARPGRCGCAGESEPITTAAPPRWRRISSAMA